MKLLCKRCGCEYDPRYIEEAEGRESGYCRACWRLLRYGKPKS